MRYGAGVCADVGKGTAQARRVARSQERVARTDSLTKQSSIARSESALETLKLLF